MKKILICFFILYFYSSSKLFSQKDDYVKPETKTHYNVFISCPTTRGIIYSLGFEREQIIKGKTSFASSAGLSAVPLNNNRPSKFFTLVVFIQPFHIITGGNKMKLESGISFSYLNFNLFNNQNTIPYPADEMFCGNLFIGGRYAPTKKITLHAGYMPRFIIGGNKKYYNKFLQGLELSFFYKIK